MKPAKVEIVERGQMLLVGFGFFGDPFALSGEWTEENEIGRLWNRFLAYMTENPDRLRHLKEPGVAYEVHVEHGETIQRGNYEVFVGMEVEELEDVPVEFLVKILPPTKYAVFTLGGEDIISDWGRMIFYEWMPGSGYERSHKYGLQLYDSRFKSMDNLEDSEIDVYIPVKPVG